MRDESATKSTLMHELQHAKDLCKAGHGFTCGDFTVDSVNNGDFDEMICTEIHAYAKEHLKLPGLGAEDVKKHAFLSISNACEFAKRGNNAEEKFGDTLKGRIDAMYEKCINGL